MNKQRGDAELFVVSTMVVTITFALLGFSLWFFPWWNVWSSEQSGKAALAKAESRRTCQ